MALTLFQSQNFAETFLQYAPFNVGFGQEPMVSVASFIRSTIMSAPLTWPWNRNENSTIFTTPGVQNYALAVTDFGFLEKVSLQVGAKITNVLGSGTVATMTANNSFAVGNVITITGLAHTAFNGVFTVTAANGTSFQFASATVQSSTADSGTAVTGTIVELKDALNVAPLSVSSDLQRPSAVSVITRSAGVVNLRFLGVPNKYYQVTVTYQKLAVIFGPFIITSVANAVGGNTTYTGTFDVDAFPTGATAQITNFATSANNGSFTVVSVNATTLIVANGAGTAVTATGYVSNFAWAPVPDNYAFIYNTLFLGEMMALEDDARAQTYRQRGMAALLSKAEGLSETQKDVFMQQWMARGVEQQGITLRAQIANQQGKLA
jgi:hypothetical protein